MATLTMQEQSSPYPETLFQQLEAYTWSTDTEFQNGLQAILTSSSSSSSQEQTELLTLRARCFYFSRKNHVSIDFDAYQEWRNRRHSSSLSSSSQPTNDPSNPPTTTPNHPSPTTIHHQTNALSHRNRNQNHSINEPTNMIPSPPPSPSPSTSPSTVSASAVVEEAQYPTSFSHIVELITSGQPVPGIKEVPATLLSGQESPAVIVKRKKPWEQGGEVGGHRIQI